MSFQYNIISNFLSYDECDSLINYYFDKLKPSQVIGESYLRNSDDYFIDQKEIESDQILHIVNNLKNKFFEISGLSIENQEMLTIIKYQPGQSFKTHYDSFTEKNQLDVQELIGGQRVWTFIVCLKEATSGGLTHFDNLNESVKLKAGECIFWKNIDENGEVFKESLHSGQSPDIGEKWILNCWIRERKHIPIGHQFLSDLMVNFTKEQLIEVLNNI